MELTNAQGDSSTSAYPDILSEHRKIHACVSTSTHLPRGCVCVYVCDVKKDTAMIISEYLNFDPLLFYLLYCLDGNFTRVNHFFPLGLERTHPEMVRQF